MSAREKAEVLDGAGLDRALTRIGHEIVEQAGGADLALVGIKTRGETLAARIAQKIAIIEGKRPAVGALDITLYRDDLGTRTEQPQLSVGPAGHHRGARPQASLLSGLRGDLAHHRPRVGHRGQHGW